MPPRAGTSRPKAVDRLVLNGILYVLITGCGWMDMPIRYGSYKTAWKRLKRWQEEGVWDRVFKALESMRSYGKAAVDGSTVEAEKGELIGYDGFEHRKGSKIHLCLEEDSIPLNFTIGLGSERDSRMAEIVQKDDHRIRKTLKHTKPS